jgi:hypothetical protein
VISSPPSPEEVQLWLEWAGEKLLSLDVRGIRPSSYRSFWPDYPDDPHTAFGYTQETLRISPPGANEIPIMDEILSLPSVCSLIPTRRILHARALIYPTTGNYKNSWSRLAEDFHSDPKTIKRWHRNGLNEILEKESLLKLRGISLRLGNNVLAKI